MLLLHVEKVSEHPAGPGLINSPEPGRITAYGFASRAPRDVLKGDREGSEALWRVRGDERAARADKVCLRVSVSEGGSQAENWIQIKTIQCRGWHRKSVGLLSIPRLKRLGPATIKSQAIKNPQGHMVPWGFLGILVPRDGIEPPTRGFSIPCSTD